jgi:hypothetical protein
MTTMLPGTLSRLSAPVDETMLQQVARVARHDMTASSGRPAKAKSSLLCSAGWGEVLHPSSTVRTVARQQARQEAV